MSRRTFLLCALGCFFISTNAPAGEPFKFPEGKHGTGELRYINKLPVLVVSGTPDEIGAAAGTLAVKPAGKALDYPKEVMEYFSAGAFWKAALAQGKAMAKRFPENYRTEMDALTRASGADADKIIAGNTLFDIKKIILCSSVMLESDRSATGGPLVGRNLDYPSLDYIHEYSLVTVYRPKDKHAFVSVGFPGLIGCLSGMNDAGLTVSVLEVMAARDGEGRFNPEGIPYALCFRTLLEDCTTIEQAKKKLETLPRTTMFNMIVADRNKVGTFEVTPKSVVFRPSEEGICACTNHFCTDIKPKEKVNIAGTYDRFDALMALKDKKEKQTVEDVRKKLDEVNLGRLTLQTMVFEPATLKLHLTFGEPPASRGKLKTLELAELLIPGEKR